MSDTTSRLMRAFPILGLAAHFLQKAERLRVADEEDAAYKATMEAMDAQPRLLGATRAREIHIIVGQLIGYMLATVVGFVIALSDRQLNWSLFVPAIWGVALILDAAGGRLSASLYDQRAEAKMSPVLDEIIGGFASQEGGRVDEGR